MRGIGMSDPRFDGSLDAPTFVGQPDDCAECGRPAGHPNHDERNSNGHFFNSDDPLIAERTEEPAPMLKPSRKRGQRFR